MGMTLTLCLVIFAIVFLLLDILLALFIGLVLPSYLKGTKTFPVDKKPHTFNYAVSYCSCLNKVYPDETKRLIYFVKLKNVRKHVITKRSVDSLRAADIKKYGFLVSVSLPAYRDDLEHKVFVCNGLVQSTEWMLTSKTCVQNETEWYNLTVRSESPFWSHLGLEHGIVDVVQGKYDGLVQLKVSPAFSERVLPFPSIKYPFTGKWNYAFSLGWKDRMYNEKLAFRHKYKIFAVEKWETETPDLIEAQVCLNCEDRTSKPLLTSCHQLIGFSTADKNTFSILSNQSSTIFKACGGCYQIYQDNTNNYENVDICHN